MLSVIRSLSLRLRSAAIFTLIAIIGIWATGGSASAEPGLAGPAVKSSGGGGGGCGQPEPAMEPWREPTWRSGYRYHYEPPAKSEPKSVDVTIAVINPYFKDEDNSLNTAEFRPVAKGWSTSMGVDLDNILIAKGMTAAGPFNDLEEVTYSVKKNCILVLAPKVFVTAEVKFKGDWYMATLQGASGQAETRRCRNFDMKITGFVSFVLQESLTGEKMFVKKLELDEATVHGVVAYLAQPVMGQSEPDLFGTTFPVQTGWQFADDPSLDDRPDLLANYIQKMYPVVMDKAQVYLDPEEILQLKAKAQEIREQMKFNAK